MSHYTDADVQAACRVFFGSAANPGSTLFEESAAILDAVAPAIAARAQAQALREAATTYESYARDTFWRDDSPFHASGRFHGECAAEWMQKRADEIEQGQP